MGLLFWVIPDIGLVKHGKHIESLGISGSLNKEEKSCNKTDQKFITDLGHAGVDPLQLLHAEVVGEPDYVVVTLEHLGLVNPDSGGDTWSFSAHFIFGIRNMF